MRLPSQCPECGWDCEDSPEPEEDCLEIGAPMLVRAAQMEYGGMPLEWEETWKCRECHFVWIWVNCNF